MGKIITTPQWKAATRSSDTFALFIFALTKLRHHSARFPVIQQFCGFTKVQVIIVSSGALLPQIRLIFHSSFFSAIKHKLKKLLSKQHLGLQGVNASYFHRHWRWVYLDTAGATSELWWGAKSKWCPSCSSPPCPAEESAQSTSVFTCTKIPHSSSLLPVIKKNGQKKFTTPFTHKAEKRCPEENVPENVPLIRSGRCWDLQQLPPRCSSKLNTGSGFWASIQTVGGQSDWLGAQLYGAVS